MKENKIKFPCAVNFKTGRVVGIYQVNKENITHLGCPECGNPFIAVLRHRTPHFKHKANTVCTSTNESYLHWLAKDVFNDIKEIETPELFINDLPINYREYFQQRRNEIIDPNVPETFRIRFKKKLKTHLSNSEIVTINQLRIEEIFISKFGNVKIDIVVNSDENKLFIEPFFSNPIDDEKKEKLASINTPTLSINLKKFLGIYGTNFSLSDLKEYLISKDSKKWVFVSDHDYKTFISNYENYLFEELKKDKELINHHQKVLNEISTLEKSISNKEETIFNLQNEISDSKFKIEKLKEDNDIYY